VAEQPWIPKRMPSDLRATLDALFSLYADQRRDDFVLTVIRQVEAMRERSVRTGRDAAGYDAACTDAIDWIRQLANGHGVLLAAAEQREANDELPTEERPHAL
jgi:hypothetical protein